MSSGFTNRLEYDDRPLAEQTMNSVLRNRADALGDRPFVRYGPEDRDASFAELNHVANAIGNALLELGIETGDKVSLLMRHPLETLFAMFGIHRAGAVYSPINFEYKGSVLRYQVNDTAPEVMFVEDRYIHRLNEIKNDLDTLPHVIVRETDGESSELDDDFEQTPYADAYTGPTHEPDVAIDCHDEASIVYTSGTTGRPKGVVLPHRWIFANYIGFGHELLNEDDVVHTSLPLYHVGGVYADVVAALVAGAQVGLWDRFSTSDFWDRIERYGATRIHLLSVMMPWLAKQPESPDDRRNTLTKVHMQPLPDNYDDLAERFGFDLVTAGFGQTEAGAPIKGVIHAATGNQATPEDVRRGLPIETVIERAEQRDIPVVDEAPGERWMGKPRSSVVDIAILDDDDERVSQGEVGELAVRPEGASLLLKEYYGKPERTVEAFQNLWFHTGDAVYEDENGYLFFVDRIGDVIRRHGENISSIQVQDILNSHPDVQQAAAFPVSAEEGGEDLVGGAVEVNDDAGLSPDALRGYLKEEMPEFMVPDRLYVVDEIPTTETNKMEKYKLRSELEGTNE